MGETFGATFGATDVVALTRAVLEAAPHASEVPPEMRQGFVKIRSTADWRDRMLFCEALGSMRAGLEGGAR